MRWWWWRVALLTTAVTTAINSTDPISDDVVCNNGSAHECVCRWVDKMRTDWTPDCNIYIRTSELLAVELYLPAGVRVNGIMHNGIFYETLLRNATAAILNDHCTYRAHECAQVALPIDQNRVILLHINKDGNGTTVVDLVVTNSLHVHTLAANAVMLPGATVRILRQHIDQLRRRLGGVPVRSIHQQTIVRGHVPTVKKPSVPPSDETPVEPTVMQENRVLIIILSGIGIALLICYVVAIFKVCSDYYERKRAEQTKEIAAKEATTVKRSGSSGVVHPAPQAVPTPPRPTQYGAVADIRRVSVKKPISNSSSDASGTPSVTKPATTMHSAAIEVMTATYGEPGEDTRLVQQQQSGTSFDEHYNYSTPDIIDTYDCNNRIDLAEYMAKPDMPAVYHLPDPASAPPPPPRRRDIPPPTPTTVTTTATGAHQSQWPVAANDPFANLMFDASTEYEGTEVAPSSPAAAGEKMAEWPVDLSVMSGHDPVGPALHSIVEEDDTAWTPRLINGDEEMTSDVNSSESETELETNAKVGQREIYKNTFTQTAVIRTRVGAYVPIEADTISTSSFDAMPPVIQTSPTHDAERAQNGAHASAHTPTSRTSSSSPATVRALNKSLSSSSSLVTSDNALTSDYYGHVRAGGTDEVALANSAYHRLAQSTLSVDSTTAPPPPLTNNMCYMPLDNVDGKWRQPTATTVGGGASEESSDQDLR